MNLLLPRGHWPLFVIYAEGEISRSPNQRRFPEKTFSFRKESQNLFVLFLKTSIDDLEPPVTLVVETKHVTSNFPWKKYISLIANQNKHATIPKFLANL